LQASLLGIVVVTSDPEFFGAVHSVLQRVQSAGLCGLSVESDLPAASSTEGSSEGEELFSIAAEKAKEFLGGLKIPLEIHLLQSNSWAESLDSPERAFPLGLCIADLSTDSEAAKAEAWLEALEKRGVPTRFSECSFALFSRDYRKAEGFYAPRPEFLLRAFPGDLRKFKLEILNCVFTYLDHTFTDRLRARQLQQGSQPVTLGLELSRFMAERAKSDWLLFYYTGSVVSTLIHDLQNLAEEQGALCLRGPSEHSLACGALANWQLHQRPFVIIVTCGMIDEFKGTLANLRQARAKGFIICAENRPSQWFAFQGTINPDEDSRAVLKAKGIPHVFISEPDEIGAGLAEAFRLYGENEGPVVILATPQVLESKQKVVIAEGSARSGALPEGSPAGELDRVMEILNREPIRILWQCGDLTAKERDLVLSIAQRAGIGLADSIDRPGTVAAYRGAERIPNYLGTLGVYGFSRKIYDFLHNDGELRSKDEQCVFFLKSKLPQVATPFPEGVLQRRMKVVQVNREPTHLSPFSDVCLAMPLRDFLAYVEEKLAVEPDVLESRKKWLLECSAEPRDILGGLESVPMSPNYFFRQLNHLVEELIETKGYSYTGVYDVGRCGVSAIRNVARTGPGFSGWYGRALMGDAYQALLFLTFTTQGNIIAFVGDGAKNLVPGILPGLLENSLNGSGPLSGNVTVFFCLNGSHSIISTYQERFKHRVGGRQMSVVSVLEPEREMSAGGVQFSFRDLHSFDRDMLEESLTASSRVSFFNVFLNHDNAADGISLLSELDWHL
jgi:hypothetical protein